MGDGDPVTDAQLLGKCAQNGHDMKPVTTEHSYLCHYAHRCTVCGVWLWSYRESAYPAWVLSNQVGGPQGSAWRRTCEECLAENILKALSAE